jgi:hypothetical protein
METALGGIPVLRHLVAVQLIPPIVNSFAPGKQACVWLLQPMPPIMIVPVATGSKCLCAALKTALVWLLSLVHTQMLHQITFLVKSFLAWYFCISICPGAGKYLFSDCR